MRTIDADALTKKLKNVFKDNRILSVLEIIDNAPTVEHPTDEWCTDCKEYDHEKNCCPRFCRVIRETLKDSEQPTGEWIPVSEKLPQIATKCFVTLSNGYITIGEYFSIDKWVFIETSFHMVYPRETVIAWMPLPEPYTKGGEGE